MRKNAPRKWIHAILDLLPLLVIPIFAININQKEVEPITAQVEESKIVNFNQIMVGGNFTSYDGWYTSLVDFTIDDNVGALVNFQSNDAKLTRYVNSDLVIEGHKYLYSAYIKSFDVESVPCFVSYLDSSGTFYSKTGTETLNNFYHFNYIEQVTTKFSIPQIQIRNLGSSAVDNTLNIKCINIYDLTKMFGSGNEPSIEQFNTWYPDEYYSFTLSQKDIVYTGNQITLNNTDIGSQFLYSMYTPVKDYFNFNQLFNMQNIYDWVQVNLFNGMAPLPVFIVWNIIVYEFFVDLIFLLYAVFMFFIDFATNMIDSFTGRCK